MNPKENFKDLVKWGSESEEHKKQAIKGAAALISILNQVDHPLNDQELNNIIGGTAAPAAFIFDDLA